MKSRIEILKDRAFMMGKVRKFFAKQGVLEVDCPILSFNASIETHIDLIPALYNQKDTCYLHSSPEYGMKCLLSEGLGDIYQLSHVFRDGEFSPKHNPEFMMVEWYRQNLSFHEMIEETFAFIHLFLGTLPTSFFSYRDAFKKYCGLDYLQLSQEDLLGYISKKNIPPYSSIEKENKDALLNLILGYEIEPQLGNKGLCALGYYPSTQAALAKTVIKEGEEVAERFEIYYKGIELCNGYHELTDPKEQRRRIEQANREKMEHGKSPLPIDELFLKALENGLPDTCGVAVGFDRLMMLRHNTDNLEHVIPFRLQKLL